MRPWTRRTKKLLVAFHFLRANQAAWECDSCRRAGLEAVRRCAMHDGIVETQKKIVWARRDVTTDRCPVSMITASSKAWVERYYLWKSAGSRLSEEMASRDAEAFLALLEAEQEESRNAQNTVTQ